MISLSQITSTPKSSNYCDDSNEFLLDYFDNSKKKDSDVPHRRKIIPKPISENSISSEYIFPTVIAENGKCVANFNLMDMNHIYKLAGGCVFNYLKKPICEDCKTFIKSNIVDDKLYTTYFDFANHGGLTRPNSSIFNLVINVELLYREWKQYLLRNDCDVWIEKVVTDINLPFPSCDICYSLKRFLVNHYFKIRSFSVANFSECKKRKKATFGTATKKKENYLKSFI